MNYRTINKSNTITSLLKVKVSNLCKYDFDGKLKNLLQKLSSISNYLFNDAPYLFDDNKEKNDIYNWKESYNYKDNTDLRLIESRRTFL
ncbi:MAG: hypothetical protein Q4F66_11290 [Clostridium sp.]|nr:hypothetical protein [Clostridium sp.]